MDEMDLEKRLTELEQRVRELSRNNLELAQSERRLHNLVLRLGSTVMAVTERLQKNGLIKPDEFEKRSQYFLKSLDREISEKKTTRLLDDLLEHGEDKE
jgi:hypothetical protein